MARGGRRTGAGRKPGPKAGVVIGMDGMRRGPALPPAVSEDARAVLSEPPGDLPEAEQGCWRIWAPLALEERTLTPTTVAGFRELCIRMANVQAIDSRIRLLGIGTQDSLPYLKERRGQAAQLASALKDFKLTAFGKPVTSAEVIPAANPFAAFGGR